MEEKIEKELKWAVLGTGIIANEMAQALEKMGKNLYAVANRTNGKAVEFAEKYGVQKVYDNIEDMFTDEETDIIYITTPHNTHIKFMIEALKNGKHVLCEKSITLNSEELEEAVKIAKEKNLILGEAMTIFNMPLYTKLSEIVNSGKLGDVKMIQVNFGSYKEYDMNNRFFNRNLAGGALLDIGVYAISITRLFMTSKPDNVLSQVKYAPTGVDEQVGIIMMNKEQQMSTIALTLHSKQPKRVVIACEKAYIEITEYPRADKAKIVHTETGEVEEITAGMTSNALQYELQNMEESVKTGINKMKLEYTIDVMDIMTKLRKEWGMTYPEEE